MKWLTQRIVAPSLARSNRISRPSSGDDSDVEIPVPIPNTEVKHINADDSRKAKIGSCQFNAPLGEFFCFPLSSVWLSSNHHGRHPAPAVSGYKKIQTAFTARKAAPHCTIHSRSRRKSGTKPAGHIRQTPSQLQSAAGTFNVRIPRRKYTT